MLYIQSRMGREAGGSSGPGERSAAGKQAAKRTRSSPRLSETLARSSQEKKKPSRRRDKLLVVRFTARELESLRKASRQIGVPLSQMVRDGLDLYLTSKVHEGLKQHLKDLQ